MVSPPRAGLTPAQRTTTYTYFPDNAQAGAGQLQSVTGPLPGSTTSYTYDAYGRTRTVTDSDGYSVTNDYDLDGRPTRTTYPDGTYEEIVYNRFDPERRRDRLGRWTYTFYDALRRVTATRDPAGRTTSQVWCSCGALDKIIDANGNATT
jgi:YD repeat-containing protein